MLSGENSGFQFTALPLKPTVSIRILRPVLPLRRHFQDKLLTAGSFHEQSKVIRLYINSSVSFYGQFCLAEIIKAVVHLFWRIASLLYNINNNVKFSKLNRVDFLQKRLTLSIHSHAIDISIRFELSPNADDKRVICRNISTWNMCVDTREDTEARQARQLFWLFARRIPTGAIRSSSGLRAKALLGRWCKPQRELRHSCTRNIFSYCYLAGNAPPRKSVEFDRILRVPYATSQRATICRTSSILSNRVR